MNAKLLARLRNEARDIFLAGVEAAKPAPLVSRFLIERPDLYECPGDLVIIAIGKAACSMGETALAHLPENTKPTTLIVTNTANPCILPSTQIIYGEHPTPDKGSALAGSRILQIADGLGKGDKLLLLLSGGGSAMQACPPSGLPLTEKAKLTDKLIRSGSDITEINIVRKCLSLLKGGGLAMRAKPASIVSLILSDVPHDNIEFVASGPTVFSSTGPAEGRLVLEKYDLWSDLPRPIKSLFDPASRLQEDLQERDFSHVENILIGGNALSVKASREAAQIDYDTISPSDWLDGDAKEAAQILHNAIEQHTERKTGMATAFICGGETTVQVKGKGSGGRNQELALYFALADEQRPLPGCWVFLSGGTDGIDGPTDAAGAIVDQTTLARIRSAGIDPETLLADNNAYNALAPVDDLLMIGGTGTNVADLQVILHVPDPLPSSKEKMSHEL